MKWPSGSKSSGGLFDLDLKQEIIANFEEKMTFPDFWDDNDKAQSVISELNAVKSVVEQYDRLNSEQEDLQMMLELAEEESDESLEADVVSGVEELVRKVERFRASAAA